MMRQTDQSLRFAGTGTGDTPPAVRLHDGETSSEERTMLD